MKYVPNRYMRPSTNVGDSTETRILFSAETIQFSAVVSDPPVKDIFNLLKKPKKKIHTAD